MRRKQVFYIVNDLKYDFLRLIESRNVAFMDYKQGEFIKFTVSGSISQVMAIVKDWDSIKSVIETSEL